MTAEKVSGFAVILMLLLVIPASAVTILAENDVWASPQGGPGNTAHYLGDGPAGDGYDSFILKGYKDRYSGPPVVDDANIYISYWDQTNPGTHYITCYSKDSGKKVWDYSFNKIELLENTPSIVISGDQIVFNKNEEKNGVTGLVIAALNKDTGTIAWESDPLNYHTISGEKVTWNGRNLLVYEGKVYISSRYNEGESTYSMATCFDATDGSIVWQHQMYHTVVEAPSAYGDKIIYATEYGTIYTFSATEVGEKASLRSIPEGKILWEAKITGTLNSMAAVDNTGVYISTVDERKITKLDLEDGSIIWERYIFHYAMLGVVTIYLDDDNVYATNSSTRENSTIFALSKETGEHEWNLSKDVFFNKFGIAADNGLFITADDRNDKTHIYRIHGPTGTILWDSVFKDDNVRMSNAISDGKLYVTSWICDNGADYPIYLQVYDGSGDVPDEPEVDDDDGDDDPGSGSEPDDDSGNDDDGDDNDNSGDDGEDNGGGSFWPSPGTGSGPESGPAATAAFIILTVVNVSIIIGAAIIASRRYGSGWDEDDEYRW